MPCPFLLRFCVGTGGSYTHRDYAFLPLAMFHHEQAAASVPNGLLYAGGTGMWPKCEVPVVSEAPQHIHKYKKQVIGLLQATRRWLP